MVLFAQLFIGQINLAQNRDCSNVLSYENNNQIEPELLVLSSVSGVVEDAQGVNIPDVRLGVFTEVSKKIIAQTRSDEGGKFGFSMVPAGKYRLIAKYKPFCTANIPIKIVKNKNKMKKRKIVVHMESSRIDTCSYGDYK